MLKKLLFILIVCSFVSCEKYFVPDIDPQIPSYVFEGLITNIPGDHYVRISSAFAFNSKDTVGGIDGFEVFIESEKGLEIPLVYTSRGYYKGYTENKGEVGSKYRFVAQSPEGKMYVSDFEEMFEGAGIKDMSGSFKEEIRLKYYNDLGYKEEKLEGIQIENYVDAKNFTPFYRYEYDIVIQTRQVYPGATGPVYVYVAYPTTSRSIEFISILNSNQYTNAQVSKNPVHFITEDFMGSRVDLGAYGYDDFADENYDIEDLKFYQEGFLILLKQYSLSERGYDFWSSIDKQNDASGQIFDPVESQIKGNVYCVEDSTEQVFGFFGASKITEMSKYYRLGYPQKVIVKPTIYFPDLDGLIASQDLFDFRVY